MVSDGPLADAARLVNGFGNRMNGIIKEATAVRQSMIKSHVAGDSNKMCRIPPIPGPIVAGRDSQWSQD